MRRVPPLPMSWLLHSHLTPLLPALPLPPPLLPPPPLPFPPSCVVGCQLATTGKPLAMIWARFPVSPAVVAYIPWTAGCSTVSRISCHCPARRYPKERHERG